MDLPADELLLARTNAHLRDERVRFDPVAHKYWIDGTRYPSSVSGLIHDSFPQFDAEGTVERCYSRWATDEYGRYAALISFVSRTLRLGEAAAKAEIVRTWAASGARASGAGTDTHLQIELQLNDEAHNGESPEFQQYRAWRATRPTWVPYRTEWSVFSEPELICGQIDSVFKDTATGELHMADWKRVGEMKKVGFNNERGYAPFDKLPNTNYGHYIVQQNVYTWMLETHYGLRISSMCLVQVHPDLAAFAEHPLPRITAAVEAAMEARRARVAAGELKTMTPEEVAARPAPSESEEQQALAAARNVALGAYLRATLDLCDTPAYPTLDDADEVTRRFGDWASNKTHRFHALINYITGTLGLPPDLARLEIARALAGEGTPENVVAASNKRRSPPERMEALKRQLTDAAGGAAAGGAAAPTTPLEAVAATAL